MTMAGLAAWLWETKRNASQVLKLSTNLTLQTVMNAEAATSTFAKDA